jgi:hypothetical protein
MILRKCLHGFFKIDLGNGVEDTVARVPGLPLERSVHESESDTVSLLWYKIAYESNELI